MLGLSTFEYNQDGYRECSVTNLKIHKSAEDMVKLFGLTSIIALAIGGIFALFVALTRWRLISLLTAQDFYTYLSLHAWYLLIFWMVFMEIAILYVGGPLVLERKLPLKKLSKTAWGVMVVGGLIITAAIWFTSQSDNPPLLTSYVPLPSSWQFYLGAIIFILGTVLAALPFFVTIWKQKITDSKSLPLITFGAFITSIIALEALVGGLITYIPTFLWRIEVLEYIDPAWYRQMYWMIGHGTQQINLLAMITIWYFMTHIVGDAEVASEKISRSAFVLYLFFINMGAAHHLLSDPAISTGWKLWNTSYAAYGAVIASMIHAFAIPAGLEAGRRRKNKGSGIFGWLWSSPWENPGFSATILSIILFGFLGGITGVMMGQFQLNMTWHNTLAVPGHFHGTVATGTTLAFMGLGYYILRLIFGRDWIGKKLASIQPYLYASSMGIAVLMMMYLGVLFGIPRRWPTGINIPGTGFSYSSANLFFAIFGITAIIAVIAGAIFIAVAVGSLLIGKKFTATESTNTAGKTDGGKKNKSIHEFSMRGTFTLTIAFLVVFVILWAMNWFLLSQLWSIGP